MPDPDIADLHLFIDFETSGLLIGCDRILEIAWTITDSSFRMLTPLRQRLACIEPDMARLDCDGDLFNSRRALHWDDASFFDQRGQAKLVQEMHTASGLARDHLNNPAPEMVLTHARHFERLYLDDLHTAKKRVRSDRFRVVISGAGVSHMDVYMLADLLPETFPLLPNPDGSSGLAYWQLDTSIAGRVLGAPTADKLRRWLKDPECPFDLIACEAGQDLWNEDPGLIKQTTVEGDLPGAVTTEHFDLTGAVAHRAAADVAWSLVDARLMRKITEAPDLLTSRY